ncbi:MAG: hypothetical protein ACFFCQ_05540 [Promethearchaeota archaeon]
MSEWLTPDIEKRLAEFLKSKNLKSISPSIREWLISETEKGEWLTPEMLEKILSAKTIKSAYAEEINLADKKKKEPAGYNWQYFEKYLEELKEKEAMKNKSKIEKNEDKKKKDKKIHWLDYEERRLK